MLEMVYLNLRYLNATKFRQDATSPKVITNVIGFSLWNGEKDYIYGALRNVQLAALYFPGWKVKIFLGKQNKNGKNVYIPDNVVKKIKVLGADITYIDSTEVNVPKALWNVLLADESSVENFIIRDVRHRLSRSDADVVKEWLFSGRSFHCIRDHRAQIVPEWWGANRRKLKKYLGNIEMKEFIKVTNTTSKKLPHFIMYNLREKIILLFP